MTAPCVERILDNRAITYIRSQLSVGGSLGRTILAEVPIEEGTVSTFVEANSQADLYDWNTGGKVAQPKHGAKVAGGIAISKHDADPDVVRALLARSAADGVALIFSENVNAKRTDPWLARSQLRHAYAGTDVFNVVRLLDGEAKILESIRQTKTSWYELTVWTAALRESWLASGAQIGPDSLEEIAAETRYLMIGAYDGESYLIWRRL